MQASGCPTEGIFNNSAISADTNSNNTFTVTCDTGYSIINSAKRTQTVECIGGNWTEVLPCVVIGW